MLTAYLTAILWRMEVRRVTESLALCSTRSDGDMADNLSKLELI